MADLTVSLSDTLQVSIASGSTWGAFNWLEGNWGYGNPGDLWYSNFLAGPFFDTQTVEDESALLQLGDGSGYNYVFKAPSTNAENRLVPTYSSGAAASTSWTCAAAAGGVWT